MENSKVDTELDVDIGPPNPREKYGQGPLAAEKNFSEYRSKGIECND